MKDWFRKLARVAWHVVGISSLVFLAGWFFGFGFTAGADVAGGLVKIVIHLAD